MNQKRTISWYKDILVIIVYAVYIDSYIVINWNYPRRYRVQNLFRISTCFPPLFSPFPEVHSMIGPCGLVSNGAIWWASRLESSHLLTRSARWQRPATVLGNWWCFSLDVRAWWFIEVHQLRPSYLCSQFSTCVLLPLALVLKIHG